MTGKGYAPSVARQGLVAAFLLSGAAEAEGTISGRVSVAGGAGTSLQGTIIRIQELGREAAADRDGRYQFSGVPAGRYKLSAQYLGANEVVESISVVDNAETAKDFVLGDASVKLKQVLVVGQLAGQAGALNRQRAADNIKTVVDFDAINQYPDQNVAESLQRLPGLSVARDQGEGRFVVIRGLDPALNAATVNGVRVGAPQNDTRAVNLDVIATDLLEGLEVTKTLTPDLDGDGIGGNIEIKTATAFDRGNSFSLRSEGSYNDQREIVSPRLAATATRLLSLAGKNDFGVSGGVSYFRRRFGSDNVETAGFPFLEAPDGSEVPGLEEGEQRDYTITRERLSTTLNFDWRPSTDHQFYLRTLYSSFEDDEVQQTTLYAFDQGEVSALDDNGGEFLGAEVQKEASARIETQRIFTAALGAKHHFGPWHLDYVAAQSVSNEKNPNSITNLFVGEGLDLGYSLNSRRKPLLFGLDDSVLNADNYALDEIEFESTKTEERETSFALNLKRDLSFGGYPGHVQVGGKARIRKKTNEGELSLYDGFGDDDVPLSAYANNGIRYPLGNFGPGVDTGRLRSFFNAGRDGFEVDGAESAIGSRGGDYRIDEDIYAGYALAAVDINALRVLGGVRVEHTDYKALGTQVTIDEVDGDGDPSFAPFTGERQYTNVLPSLHFRYRFSKRLLGRLAYTQALARPGYEDAAPRLSVEITDNDGEIERVAEAGNPDLKPLRAQNVDLAFEYYPGGVGVVSAGAFYKRIKNFIVIADVAGSPGFEAFDEVFQAVNGNTAEVYGLELGYTQSLRFLPSPFDGLLVSANATFVDSQARLPFRDEKVSLPRQSDQVGNLALGYEKYGFSARISATYRSAYLDSFEELDDPRFDRSAASNLQFDFTGSYQLTDYARVYVNLINLNDEPFYAYLGSKRYNSQYEEYGFTGELGIKLNF
ncbi:TonB-dependent receptor [Nevskia ramosa]|uniref:TonB-dependent receptor n=1 Tax=Nevskia ramosa TaxID=64002 RepID=UPI003D0D37C2